PGPDPPTVQDRPVPGHHPLLDVLRHVVVGVDDDAVLQVDAGAEGDPGQVAADDDVKPQVDAGGQVYVTDDQRGVGEGHVAHLPHQRLAGHAFALGGHRKYTTCGGPFPTGRRPRTMTP